VQSTVLADRIVAHYFHCVLPSNDDGEPMTAADIRAIASSILEKLVADYPAESAAVAAVVLSELLEAALFAADDEAAIGEFVLALNARIDEIALRRKAKTSWHVVRSDAPQRH